MFCEGRLEEAEECARRALRRAATPEGREGAVAAVGTLVLIVRRQGSAYGSDVERLASWAERVPDSPERSWMIWERARLLARLGSEEEALAETERAVEMLAQTANWASHEIRYNAEKYRSETLLETKRPERAAEVWTTSDLETEVLPFLKIMAMATAWQAAEESVPERWMNCLRTNVQELGWDTWIYREGFGRIERRQVELTAA